MPHRLGRYAVRRRIGSGGFATVWLAHDEQLDSPVAVKVLADNWTEDAQIRRRFAEEGRYLRKVESPHVVTVYDAGELEDGRPYLVMSYADQGTLADRLEVEGLSVLQALEVVRQIGLGLQALHDRGIVHRDVKPANVLFRTVEGSAQTGGDEVRVMVGDLGLGKALDMSSRLTMIAGTPSFVAPEQAAAESPDARADQYSLAALTYLLLAGRPPFTHASLAEAMRPAEVASVSSAELSLPAEVDQVLVRGLSPAREDRFEDVTGFIAALESALAPVLTDASQLTAPLARPAPLPAFGTLPAPTPASSPAPRRHRVRGLLVGSVAGLIAIAVGGGGGYAAQRSLAGSDLTVQDRNGTLSVTVPADWDSDVADDGWLAPYSDSPQPALSVGGPANWADTATGQGVFVGLLAGTDLPEQVPQHPECDVAGRAVLDSVDDDDSVTVVYSGCPGGGVLVERVVQLTANTLMWVQIRADERATANQVLDSVTTFGI